jgi:hypothetical protein
MQWGARFAGLTGHPQRIAIGNAAGTNDLLPAGRV